MTRRKLHRYTGNEVASQPSIAEQLLKGTKVGELLYGKPTEYTDGYGVKHQDATFKESTNGQLVQRMGETAKNAGNLALTGLAFGNPLTASNAMAPLITGAQTYWVGHGIQDGAQRIENIEEGVKNFVEDPSWQSAGEVAKEVPMLALDVADVVPVAKTVKTVINNIPKNPVFTNFNKWNNFSKSGKISAKNMLEYRLLELKNGLNGINIKNKADALGISPNAFIQSQSSNFRKFLGDAPFKVKYHGTPVKNATVFPNPKHKMYKGKLPGTGTYEEGIYVSSNPSYAERYSYSGIGLYPGSKTGDVHQVVIGGNPTSLNELSSLGVTDNWRCDAFQHFSTKMRNQVESLGFNIIDDALYTRFDKKFDETMVFEPWQIKSLEGNNGNFSRNSINIYE